MLDFRNESGMSATYAGIPLWGWIVGGAVLVGVILHFRKSSSPSTNSPPAAGQPLNVASPSGSNPSGVTDANNVPWQDTWPYNQLALPFNYNSMNANQTQANIQYVDPQNPGFPGYQSTAVTNG